MLFFGGNMYPLQAIRKQCLFCMNNQPTELQKCVTADCVFYDYRFRKNKSDPRIPTLKQIKKYCYDCSDNNYAKLRRCAFNDCSLYQFRFGKNPKLKGKTNKGSFKKQYSLC
jgi:hypothetical protein